MSFTVTYTERLTGQVWRDFTLPPTRQDAIDWYHQLLAKATSDPEHFKLEARLAMAVDLYVLALFMSCSQRLDPFTGRPEIDCDFQFEQAREWQFDSDGVVVTTAREHWKSTWCSHVMPTQDIIIDPNETIGLFSFQKQAAQRHLGRWMHEVEQNEIIKNAWDEVFWADPKRENAEGWSIEAGATVKRSIVSQSPTFGAYTFMKDLPVGSRFGIEIFDDCETDGNVRTPEARKAAFAQFKNALNLGARVCRKRIPGTFHHSNGLLRSLIDELGMRHRCHNAEDTTLEPPDIAALYDRFEGRIPNGTEQGTELPRQVREIKLEGAPVYLHALELAKKRFEMGEAVYYMQNMSDPVRGQKKKLLIEWVSGDDVRYTSDPREIADGANLYPLSDPSKGQGDPCANLMMAIRPDGKLALVDATRRRLSPDEWLSDMFRLSREWDSIGVLQQFRIEEYGQSTWVPLLRNHFDRYNYYGAEIVPCNNYDRNRVREWTRLEPLFRQRRILLPEKLMIPDDEGRPYDFIRYFVLFEYLKFPLLDYDDVVAALALLGDEKAGELRRPEPHWRREREREERRHETDGGSWMSGGLA